MTALYTIAGIYLETWHNADLRNFLFYLFIYISLAQAFTVSQTKLLYLHLLSTGAWGVGGQKKPLQNVPIWYVDYFELKAIKTQQMQKKLLPSP